MTYNEILSAASPGKLSFVCLVGKTGLLSSLWKQPLLPFRQGPRNATLQVQGLRQDFHRIYRHVAAEAPQERACEGIHATDVRTEVP